MDKSDKNAKPDDVDSLLQDNDLMTLVELQKFLAEELAEVDGDSSFSRAFLPLTDGLGLTSPLKKEAPPAKPMPPHIPAPAPKPSKRMPTVEIFDTDPLPQRAPILVDLTKTEPPMSFFSETAKAKEVARLEALVDRKRQAEEEDEIQPTERLATRSLAAAISAPVPEATPEPVEAPAPAAAMPPPVPEATFGMRFLSGVLDEIFVLTVWLIVLVITSNALAGGNVDLSSAFVRQFSNPLFMRFAALEFATIWLAYLAIGLGVLDMTFGMWVWGTRVRYTGAKEEDAKFLRKVARVVLSFFIFAPVFPTVLLMLRVKGRNLLDLLSGTGVYRSVL